jgi:hypothetical protein
MKVGIASVASLVLCTQALAEPATYAVDGVTLGTQLNRNNAAYREYKCSSSEQFSGVTWCQKARTEKERGKTFSASYSLLHAPDGNVVYINRSQEPAFFNAAEAQQDIERYSRKIGETPRITKMPARSGLPQAMIATWGQIALEQLDQASVKLLAQGKSPRKGLLIDYLGNFARSAKEGLPIYRIAGGPGFVWSASFDQKGRGALRTAAVDASGLVLTPPVQATSEPEPTAQPQIPAVPVPAAEVQTAAEPVAGSDAQSISTPEPTAQSQPLSPSQAPSEVRTTAPSANSADRNPDRLALLTKIEDLQGELAGAGVRIAELEKATTAAQAAQKEAVKARREIEQVRAAERVKFEERIAELEATGTAPYAASKRWQNALFGAIGGLAIVLLGSAIGFFGRRYQARKSLANASDALAQAQNSVEEVGAFVASPAIAIAEDAFGRELEQQVAALNATEAEAPVETEAARQMEGAITKVEAAIATIETAVEAEGRPKDVEAAPTVA